MTKLERLRFGRTSTGELFAELPEADDMGWATTVSGRVFKLTDEPLYTRRRAKRNARSAAELAFISSTPSRRQDGPKPTRFLCLVAGF